MKKADIGVGIYLLAAIMQLNSLYQSTIILLERGLKDPANVIIRTIIELAFKTSFLEELTKQAIQYILTNINQIWGYYHSQLIEKVSSCIPFS